MITSLLLSRDVCAPGGVPQAISGNSEAGFSLNSAAKSQFLMDSGWHQQKFK